MGGRRDGVRMVPRVFLSYLVGDEKRAGGSAPTHLTIQTLVHESVVFTGPMLFLVIIICKLKRRMTVRIGNNTVSSVIRCIICLFFVFVSQLFQRICTAKSGQFSNCLKCQVRQCGMLS